MNTVKKAKEGDTDAIRKVYVATRRLEQKRGSKVSIDALLQQAKGNKLATAIVTFGLLIVGSGAVASAVKEIRWWVYPDELQKAVFLVESKMTKKDDELSQQILEQKRKISQLACDALFGSMQATRQTIRGMQADLEKAHSQYLINEIERYTQKLHFDEQRYNRDCN